jgi:hypothetical protein
LSCAVAFQAQATPFYSTGNYGNSLYTIDSDTGAGAYIGDFGYGATYALAFDKHNTLFSIVDDYNSSTLATINTATGAATLIGDGTYIPELMAMAFGPNGTLYAASWGTNDLYSIDTHTGAATDIGALGFGGIMDLAFDSHGTLYGVSGGLYTIDTTTGAGTFVSGAGDGCLMAMTIKGGNGYATDYCNGNTPLYSLSLTDGSTTAIGTGTGISGAMALTYEGVAGGVPEPASWAMMVGGFGLVGGAMRSRRKAAVSFG